MSNFDQAIALLEKGGDGATLSPNSKSEKQWAELEKIVKNHQQDKYIFGPDADRGRFRSVITSISLGAVALMSGVSVLFTMGVTAMLFYMLAVTLPCAGLVFNQLSFTTKYIKPSSGTKHKIYSMLGYHKINPQPEKSDVYTQLAELYNQDNQNEFFWNEILYYHTSYLSSIKDNTDDFVDIVMGEKRDDNTIFVASQGQKVVKPTIMNFNF